MKRIAELTEWPRNSETTRALREKSWTVVLRCYGCARRFALAKVSLDRLALAPQITPCPHCGVQPAAAPEVRVHRILDLREDTNRSYAADSSSSTA
jgi:hypothetical protein